MADSATISNLIPAENIDQGMLFETSKPDGESATGYVTRSIALSGLGDAIANTLEYQTKLETNSKTITGAINELKRGGGGGGSSVAMSDNPEGGVDLTVDDETKTLATQKDLTTQGQSLDALWKLAKGQLYDLQKVSSFGDVVVPKGAMDYASLVQLGGMSRKGKNLLSLINPNDSRIILNDDGSININGSFGNTTVFIIGNVNGLTGQALTISGCVGGSSTKYKLQVWYSDTSSSPAQDFGEGATFTLDRDCVIRLVIYSGTYNTTIYPMIGKGSTVTPFEPYTDTLIDAPVNKVVSVGKNLWKYASEYTGSSTDANQGFIVQYSDVKITKGVTYTINVNDTNRWLYQISPLSNNHDAQGNTYEVVTGQAQKTFTATIDGFLFLRCIDQGTKKNIQAEIGSTVTSYTPYREPIEKTIPQSIIDLCPDYGIGVNNEVYNYIDFETKTYHRRLGAVDLGSLNWTYAGEYMRTSKPTEAKIGAITLNASSLIFTTTTSYLRTSTTDYTDPVEFKTMMDGVMLYYELATEEIIDLSPVWTDDFDILNVEANGSVTFEYPNKDTYKVDVPNTIEYVINLNEVN